MDFELVPVLMLLSGTVLMYSAVSNKQPLGVLKAALTGGDLSKVEPIYTASSSGGVGPGAVANKDIPGTPGADGDARTDPPGYDSKDPNTGILPILPGEGKPGAGAPVTYKTPLTSGNYYV